MSGLNSTFRVSPYAPANETAQDIWSEICYLDGAILVSVAYGVHATLFFSCIAALWSQRRQFPRQTCIFCIYILIHFILGTIAFALNAKFNELKYITDRDFPGGPNGFVNAQQRLWIEFVGYVLYTITAWLQDALLLYRYWMIWNRRGYTLILPVGLYLSSIAIGAIYLAHIRSSESSAREVTNVHFFIAFWALEISMTILLTALLVGRLLYMRHRLQRILGPGQHEPYLSIATMLVESGFLFTIGGIVFLISYAYNSPFQNMVLNMIGQIQSIAPVLIIFRVARGNGLTRQNIEDTVATLNGAKKNRRPAGADRGASSKIHRIPIEEGGMFNIKSEA